MDTKILCALCSENHTETCFNFESQTMSNNETVGTMSTDTTGADRYTGAKAALQTKCMHFSLLRVHPH
jgi:hypothetical protein